MALPLPRILYAVPQTLHVRLEIAKAIYATFGPRPENPEQPPSRSQENEAARLDAELKECTHEFRRELRSLVRDHLASRHNSAIKAAVDDPKHPGWPAHTPGGKGGQFRPKDTSSSHAAGGGIARDSEMKEPRLVNEGSDETTNHLQLAMEPNDPITGAPFYLETSANRFGGLGEGGGGGGGLGGASVGASEAAGPPSSAAAQLAINRTVGAAFEQESIKPSAAKVLQIYRRRSLSEPRLALKRVWIYWGATLILEKSCVLSASRQILRRSRRTKVRLFPKLDRLALQSWGKENQLFQAEL